MFIGQTTGVARIVEDRTGHRETLMLRAALRRRQEVLGEAGWNRSAIQPLPQT